MCTGSLTLRQGRYVLCFVAAAGQTKGLLGARRWWSGSRGASTPSANSGRLPGVGFWKVENAALAFHYSLLSSVDPSWSFSEVCPKDAVQNRKVFTFAAARSQSRIPLQCCPIPTPIADVYRSHDNCNSHCVPQPCPRSHQMTNSSLSIRQSDPRNHPQGTHSPTALLLAQHARRPFPTSVSNPAR